MRAVRRRMRPCGEVRLCARSALRRRAGSSARCWGRGGDPRGNRLHASAAGFVGAEQGLWMPLFALRPRPRLHRVLSVSVESRLCEVPYPDRPSQRDAGAPPPCGSAGRYPVAGQRPCSHELRKWACALKWGHSPFACLEHGSTDECVQSWVKPLENLGPPPQ